MTPSVSENPGLRLEDSRGNPLTITVIDAHASHWLSSSEAIQAAIIVPDDFRDPVDLALRVSLCRRCDNLFHLDGMPLMRLTPDFYDPATPDRRYSVAKMYSLNTADQMVDVVIMRSELNTVVETFTMPREEGVLFRRNANMHHGRRHRSMGVAPAPIDKDGNIIGELIFEGFVAMRLWRFDEAIAENERGSGSWIEVHLWGQALHVQHWLSLALMLMMIFAGWYIVQPYLVEHAYDGSAAELAMGCVRFMHFLTELLWITVGLWYVILLSITHGQQTRWCTPWPIYNKQDIKDPWHMMQYHLFLCREGPFYFAHNLLQQLVCTNIYMVCFIQMLISLSLYVMMDQSNWFFQLLAMPTHWIGVGYSRLICTIIMYLIWFFVIVHVYLVIRSDTVRNHGGLSSMIGGSVWLPHDT